MKTIKIQGTEAKKTKDKTYIIKDETYKITDENFQLEKLVEISNIRGDASLIDLEGEDNSIVDLVMEDGIEWIGPLGDIKEIYNTQSHFNRSHLEDDILPSSLINDQERGIKEWAIKTIGLFKSKRPIDEVAAKLIGEKVDTRIMDNPGVFKLDEKFVLHPSKIKKSDHPALLFIHGTISTTHGSFKKIFDEDKTGLWNQLLIQYKDSIYGLQHKTVSVSPFQNAIDLLEKIEKGTTLDVISHSRGGIVADILSRCDHRNHNSGFAKVEINLIKKDSEDEAKLMERLNELVQEKKIQIRKVIRVACPAAGTTLLSDRLDHYLNGILNAIRLAVGGPFGNIYNVVKNFILEVIEARLTPDVLPGLLPMVPESTFQDIMNNPAIEVSGELNVIEGNSEIGGSIGHSLLVIFSNLFYWEANDFVVNTSSMIYGSRRKNGVSYLRSENADTTHFNYFKNRNTQEAIKNAVIAKEGERIPGFTYLQSQDDQRGPVLELFMKMGEVQSPRRTKDRPSVILIPGIMGSNLYVNDHKIWVDYDEIIKGKIKYALHKDAEVTADTIIARFYKDIVRELSTTYDVYLHPYDWRRSVTFAAKDLKEKIEKIQNENSEPVKIIAHSMGGLVVRSMMMQFQAFWKDLMNQEGARLLMLGTPWYGSHLIMEVITGHSRRVKQLSRLDFHHSKRELLEVFTTYDGIYQLLPTKGEAFEDKRFWTDLDHRLGKDKFIIPTQEYLDRFKSFKSDLHDFEFDFNNTIYLAGKAKGTTNSYKIKSSIFGKKLKYYKTPDGDGSVTWELGIPEGIKQENIYYCNTSHGELANDNNLYPGILDILDKGKTDKLDQSPIRDRGAESITDYSDNILSNDPAEALEIIFGGETFGKRAEKPIEKIDVNVCHGDLMYAEYPVMVGHFEDDGIMSAEAALNWRFGDKLVQRHKVGIYPGKIGESEIIIDPRNQPKGVIVIGLGNPTELTSFNLRKSVESGIISYVMTLRDNCPHLDKEKFTNGITSVLIGTGYGQLPMEDALRAILEGVTNANLILKDLNDEHPTINRIEFIELFENVANEAYYLLRNIEKEDNRSFRIKVETKVCKRLGRRKKIPFERDDSWWVNFTTELKKSKNESNQLPRLRFRLSKGIARVEEDFTFTSLNIIEALLTELSKKRIWNQEISKTLFELIIPNAFKDIIRTQKHIHWKMDMETASYPWEMFHDYTQDNDPTFVKAGLIRQLITKDFRKNPDIIKSKTALVIGDPIYGDSKLPQLKGARREARTVKNLLEAEKFKVEDEIAKSGVEILISITNREYKVLHISGHGLFDPEGAGIGIAIGDGMLMTTGTLKNLSKVPEMVFVNCCHSGEIDPSLEKYYTNRYRLAANIGTELIKMGVEAVVVAGWAVNDSAAEEFATAFYNRMLNGYRFGDAVRLARNKCYRNHKENNTWGAYQCYGDPWYRLTHDGAQLQDREEYISESEVLIELENLWIDAYGKTKKDKDIVDKMEKILTIAKKSNMYTGPVIEMEARIYREVNKIDEALEKFESLLTLDKADFRVRSLEQYCNLRAKQLVKNKITTPEKLKEVQANLETLKLIGHTPMRLNLLGSGYKRIAQMASKFDSKKTYLRKMEKAYHEAYLITQKNPSKAIYPLTNLLTARALREEYETVEIEKIKYLPLKLLENVRNKITGETRKFQDFWEEIGLINVLLCELLFLDKKKAITSHKEEIITLYSSTFDITGSLRHIQTEIEHLEFIVSVWERKRDDMIKFKMNTIKEVLEFLRSLEP